MKKDLLLIIALILSFTSVSVLAETAVSEGEKIVECSNLHEDAKVIDLTGKLSTRLPAHRDGFEYHFKIVSISKDKINDYKVTVNEQKRRSRISDDYLILRDFLVKTVSIQKGTMDTTPKDYCVSYTSVHEHSTITVKVRQKKPTDEWKTTSSKSFTAGPEEHWYLSLDVPVDDPQQLTFDSGTGGTTLKDKPVISYLGFNYRLGDLVVEDDEKLASWNRFSGKILVTASNNPSESMGLGIGYNFGAIDIFYAKLWTKANQDAGSNHNRNLDDTWGISINLSQAVELLDD